MELPSMVQRSGDTLIVRSVVSGNQLYLDQGAGAASGTHTSPPPTTQSNANHLQQQQQQQHLHNNAAALEQQLERYRVATVAQQQHYLQQQQQHQQQQQQNVAAQQQHQQHAAVGELKDEGLPQCKIKRNYSCSYCTYFTQNPRYHLTHLRDVHGEKIVINKCKLCLYASRHFQKLVRHMKMVHGCTDGIAGAHGQARGKRGMSREARKRKLEQSVAGVAGMGGAGSLVVGGVPEMPTLEQVKRELELQEQKLQRDIQAFNKQQEEQKQQQQMAATNAAVALLAYEHQLQAQAHRERERQLGRAAYEQEATNAAVAAEMQRQRQSPAASAAAANSSNKNSGFQMPPAHQQQQQQQQQPTHTQHSLSQSQSQHISNRSSSYELTSPSPTGSATPPSCGSTPTPHNNNTNPNTSAALSGAGDEPPQNRLLKCSICDFTTLYRAALVDHELEEHCKTKFFRCEKCSYVTHIKARFSKHVKYHSMPMIKCVTCDFRTPYKWNLDRHMKNHGGAGPFKCAACDFTADIKQSLTVHEMNHHVPPVGHAAGMSLARRRNKVGGTDLCDDFLSDSAELLEDHYNNNNLDEFDEVALVCSDSAGDDAAAVAAAYGKRSKYDDDEPTDLSAKGGSSDTSSVHNQSVSLVTLPTLATPKSKRPVPNLIPIPKVGSNVLNLSKDSSLSEIASMFFNEKQLAEMLQQQQLQQQTQPQQPQQPSYDKTTAASASSAVQQLLSPTTTIISTTSSQNPRSLLLRKPTPGGSFFDKLKSSALACASTGANENLICPCGHVAKCLSESIIHRKTCNFAAIVDDDIEEEDDDEELEDDRLEIDFCDEDDKQSHSALNLSVTGSTRCQHCRHRCKSSADLLNHLKNCAEAAAGRCHGHESYDSMSGESSNGAGGHGHAGNIDSAGDEPPQHPMENRVFIWNKIPRGSAGAGGSGGDCSASQCSEEQQRGGGSSAGSAIATSSNGLNEENSYYGVETAPGYGEVTKKMTAEEEAANSSLKKVYKCPHCSFWASTASRFHVHIVGHLNKKPFECSLCSYRSNWRWDITKHIRLKAVRDASHKSARVLMNDETGRRNYTKYNKYITLMKVTEEDGDPKLMKSGEMTPHQVASLAFLNDFNKNGISAASAAHLNGLKDDITLEPVVVSVVKSSAASAATEAGGADAGQQLGDGFIRLPLLATMMLAQQQQQQHQQHKDHQDQLHEHTTMITPSVTISAVKRSPPPLMKPSDDLLTDVKQEGNEKKTFYKCRKCNFRHQNRDAVLAHVKIHYQDQNYPIVTATATTTSPKSSTNNNSPQQQQQNTAPLQVTVNSNLYMNKVFAAAMCLSQQQQQNAGSPSHNQQQQLQQQQHSMLSANLLQQAIQGGATANSGLALALAAGSNSSSSIASKISPTKSTTASILEHGEQKASQNEASAQPTPTSPIKDTSPASTSGLHFVGRAAGSVGASLQRLLTSPRGTYNASSSSSSSYNHQLNSPTRTTTTTTTSTTTLFVGAGGTPTNCNNNNLVMGLTESTAGAVFNSPTGGGGGGAITRQQQHHHQQQQPQQQQQTSHSPSRTSFAIVTTLPTTTTTTTANSSNHIQMGLTGVPSTSSSAFIGNPASTSTGAVVQHLGVGVGHDSVCIDGVSVYGSSPASSNNTSLNSNINTIITTIDISTPTTTSSSTTSCNLLLSSANSSPSTRARRTIAAARKPSSTSASPISPVSASFNNISNNNNNNNNNNSNRNSSNINSNNNLLSHGDSNQGVISPYRCGHCHQVSNWKHVIQRHCRLKHSGDIRIEALDRTAASQTPVYRPVENNPTTETNFGLTLKTLQKQQQQQQQQPNLNINNTNSVLNNNNQQQQQPTQHEPHLLQLPHAGSDTKAAANSTNIPQDIQAAAAAYLAAYKAAASNANARNNAAASSTLSGDDLLLQQQLQQNDQIEITRLPGPSNLAQLLESTNPAVAAAAAVQQNSKSKQQKCPLCPYISESKSQMNYHISLHKPTQYECPLCTFVCAKKQHLSSHMRSVHGAGTVGGTGIGGAAAGGFNLDFTVALKLAAAAQAQQDNNSSLAAIDLTALKNSFNTAAASITHGPHHAQSQQHTSTSSAAQQQQQQLLLPPEYQFKMIYYCPKCPARYAQKHNEAHNAKAELRDHLHAHIADAPTTSSAACKCEFCDYRAPHESLASAHRYVHTPHYQDTYNELYRNCKEDTEYAAPRLMQITSTRSAQNHETVWVVDNELGGSGGGCAALPTIAERQQHSNISSSSAAATTTTTPSSNYDSANSLLKKQLEAGAATPLLTRETPSPKSSSAAPEDDNSWHTSPSTSASVATSDLAGDLAASSDTMAASPASPAPLEKCPHCPYESQNVAGACDEYKAHLQQHICVSQQQQAHTCEHCDYTAPELAQIETHTRLHFNAMEKLKSVAFFTSYDRLELSVERHEEQQQKAVDGDVEMRADNKLAIASTSTSEGQHEATAAAAQETHEDDLNIKQEEHNNNNEENAVNENTLSAELQAKGAFEASAAAIKTITAPQDVSPKKLPPPICTKIILYKNDGCLSIKKDPAAVEASRSSSGGGGGDNISDRLRRRISRGSNSHVNGGGVGGEEHPTATQSHKTILVNAKTGQVISRN